MRIIGIVFLVFLILIFLFAKIKINGTYVTGIFERFVAAVIFSVILTLLCGLPILGIVYLIK